jgi:hypothetical protein
MKEKHDSSLKATQEIEGCQERLAVLRQELARRGLQGFIGNNRPSPAAG